MAQKVVERIKVIDADSHVSEPADLWTSRVSTAKWGDLVPHVAVRREDPGGPLVHGREAVPAHGGRGDGGLEGAATGPSADAGRC
ncbi:MAG: hypothetical protein U5Q44_00480 [Dehalococcoidia bacterium]|nr:hypothetical protein [Dehalococcoidia bacterium]